MTGLVLSLLCGAADAAVIPPALTYTGEEAPLEFHVPGATALAAAVVNGAGVLSAPQLVAPEKFRARFRFPADRFPRVALLALDATVADGKTERHWAAVPLIARGELKISTKPRAKVTVEVGKVRYGPAVADAKGALTVSALIPPGFAAATVVAVDRAGNTTTSPLDLGAPPFVQAALRAAVGNVRAGDTFELDVFAVTTAGEPLADAAALQVRAQRGSCQPVTARGAGRFTAACRAPTATGRETFEARAGSAPPASLALDVVPGAAAKLMLELSSKTYVAGSGEVIAVRAVTADAWGNTSAAASAELATDFGAVAGGQLKVPDAFAGRTVAHVSARAGALQATADVALEAGPPVSARLDVPTRAAAGQAVEGTLEAADTFGNPLKGGQHGLSVVSSSGQRATLTDTGTAVSAVKLDVPREAAGESLELEVRSGDRPVGARTPLSVAPYQRPWAIHLGVQVNGTWNFAASRALGARLLAGLNVASTRFQVGAEIGIGWYPRLTGVPTSDRLNDGTVEMTAGSAALAARWLYDLTSRLWLVVSVGGGAQLTWVRASLGAEPTTAVQTISPLVRGALGVAVTVPGGRVLLQLESAWTPLEVPGLRGNIGGLGLSLGYALIL